MRRPLPEPSVHDLDPATGALGHRTGTYRKCLADLAGLYADRAAFDAACDGKADAVVYRVEDVRPATVQGDLIFGTTHMEPGRIGGEYYLTRGHIHARANRPETYRGEAGLGVLLLESPEGDVRTLPIGPGTTVYVPPYWIHRSVNVGDDALVMSFCYPADAGQDYDVIARAGGMAMRVFAGQDGWTTVPNAAYRPRTGDEIAAIYATGD